MGFNPQLLLTANLGEAVADWLKTEHPANTAKAIARKADMDVRTAENVLQGHLSGNTITRLIRAYSWRFIASVGAAVIGESYEQYIHTELAEIADERARLDDQEAALRGRYARLRARSALDRGGLRLVHQEDNEPHG